MSSISSPCKISPPLTLFWFFFLPWCFWFWFGFFGFFYFIFKVLAISLKWPNSTNCLKKALNHYRSVLRICDEFYHPLNENVFHFCVFPVLVEVLVWNPNRPRWVNSGWVQWVEGCVYLGTFLTVEEKRKEKGEWPFQSCLGLYFLETAWKKKGKDI